MTPLGAVARSLIFVYRYGISPILPGACRFTPSCSQFADEAIRRYGGWHGGWLALRRLARCQPFGGHGWDPVPEHRACGHDHASPVPPPGRPA